jgi:SAM-dependent methyltransferase
MDLLETRPDARRHPWELSRARAVETIARRHTGSAVRTILDWGCGDAFTGRYLLDHLGAESLVGIDPHLTDEQRGAFANGDPRIALIAREQEMPARRFDLVLCCDVIEHVSDDAELLETVRRSFLAPGGRLIVTVPAFQSLFSAHDVALKHHRRYSLGQLENVLDRSGFEVLGSGYLFGSLLPVRAVGKLFERRSASPPSDEAVGLGRWSGGTVPTRIAGAMLSADNSVLLSLAALGIKLPGLSAWAVSAPSAAAEG